jgi:hypothetical protein
VRESAAAEGCRCSQVLRKGFCCSFQSLALEGKVPNIVRRMRCIHLNSNIRKPCERGACAAGT